MKKNDLEAGINGVFWMGSLTFISYLFQLAITYFLARLLSPNEFGEFSAITILIGITEIFWMLGVGPSLVQKDTLSKNDIVTGHSLNILLGIIFFVIVNLTVNPLMNIFNINEGKMLRVFSVVFLIKSYSGVSQSLLQRKCKFKIISLSNFISLFFYGVFVIVFALKQFSTWSLIYAKIIQSIVLAILSLYFEPIKLKLKIYKESAKSLLYYGGGFTIAKVFNYIANNGDYFVVNKTMSKSNLGAYTKAYQLLIYPVNFIGNTLDQVLFPMLSKSQDDKIKLKKVFLTGTGLVALISVPISIVSYMSADSLVYFFLGEQWESTISCFKIIILGLFFRIAYKLSDSLIRALGKVYHRAIIQFIYASMVVLGSYFGHFYGLDGVATGVLFAFVLNYFLMTALSMKFVDIRTFEIIKNVLPSILYGIVTFAITYILRCLWIDLSSNFLKLLIITITVALVYSLLFILTRKIILSEELNKMVLDINNNLKNKFIKVILRNKR